MNWVCVCVSVAHVFGHFLFARRCNHMYYIRLLPISLEFQKLKFYTLAIFDWPEINAPIRLDSMKNIHAPSV